MNDGIERIKILSSEIKDKATKKIINYLLTRIDKNDKYLNEDKSLKQMIEFIKSKAKKHAEDGVAIIEDEVVFGWAIHYWDESNKDLKVKETKESEEKVEQKEETKTNIKKENWVPEGQLSLFDTVY